MTICYSIRVFFSEQARGNRADCVFLPQEVPQAALQAWSLRSEFTCCFSWLQQQGVAIYCYQRGHRIAFCGHGLLACASWWLNFNELWRNFCQQSEVFTSQTHSDRNTDSDRNDAAAAAAALTLQLQQASGITSTHIDIYAQDTPRSARSRAGRVWLQVPRIFCREISLPPAIGTWVHPMPIRAALAGPADGYRILIWPSGTDIASVVIEREFLMRDRRATILTAQHAKLGADFTLRYLAPQYGVEEDAATGSANAVLADYWTRNGIRHEIRNDMPDVMTPLRALQRSPGGGVIESEVHDDIVAISGAVAIENIARWR